jgi:hypothetical protein
MTKAYAFELPEENACIASQLVDAIPDDWEYVFGQLDAPLDKVASGQVSHGGWSLDQFRDLEVATLADYSMRNASYEERQDIMEYRRQAFSELVLGIPPLFVRFRDAGEDNTHGILPFKVAKLIAGAYIVRGYKGDLTFRGKGKCELHLAPYEGMFPAPREHVKPYMEIPEVKEAFESGNQAFIQAAISKLNPHNNFPALICFEAPEPKALLRICAVAKLKPLDPESVEPGYSYKERI